MQKNPINSIISLTAGLLGGGVALFLAVAIEIILNTIGKPFFSQKGVVFLLVLLLPALLEEMAKITIAKKLFAKFDKFWVIVGVGAGFGIAETLMSQNGLFLKLSFLLLPFFHLIFLLGGFYLSKKLFREGKQSCFQWTILSTLLHWGYNITIVIFLPKP